MIGERSKMTADNVGISFPNANVKGDIIIYENVSPIKTELWVYLSLNLLSYNSTSHYIQGVLCQLLNH